jgi:acyl-CoA synthetase (AMP-forming)/AMP-acid ligase II
VFGVPHPRWGETPVAQVVVEDGAAVTEQDVIEACRQRLGSYKKPARVLVSAQPLARTPLGKVSRKLLREPYWAGAESRIGGT